MKIASKHRAGSLAWCACGLALLAAAASPSLALDPAKAFSQYALTSWTHKNGLEPKSVMAVAQTSDGFLWLATEQGLIRFDGVAMTAFDERSAPELGDRVIRSLAADPDGSLWIGTTTGIVQLKHGKFQRFGQQSRAPWDIYDLCPDGHGGVWFSSDVGLYHFANGSSRIYTTRDGLPSNSITGLAMDAGGTLWVGTLAALVSLKNERFTVYGDWTGFRGNAINTVAAGANGTVWIGMRDGQVGRWAQGKLATWWDGRATRGKAIQCLHQDRDGTLWFAVRKLGLARMRGRDLEMLTQAEGLPGNSPDWVYEDRERSLWIGWEDAGLSMIRDTKFITFGKPEGLSSDNITTVAPAADGGLWVGTGDAGLNRLGGGRVSAITESNGLAQNEVLGLLEQRDGTLWVGARNGRVARIRNGRSTIFPATAKDTPEVRAIVEDPSGQVWLGLEQDAGLAKFNGQRFERSPLQGHARSLAFAPDGSLWVASYLVGLVRLKDGAARLYGPEDGLPSRALTSVYVDRSGAVWAGTALSGVVRWRNGKITHYSTQQGLFDNAVAGMVEDDRGYLWMAGSRGIWRVSMREMEDYAAGRSAAIHSEVYGYSDGLRSVETSFSAQPAIAKDRDGRLWFATGAGLSMIDPNRILVNSTAPFAIVQRALFDGRQAPFAKGALRPPPGNGSVEVHFTAPSFVAAEQMRFRYRLLGVQADWVEAGTNRTAFFSHLSAGNYRFEVEAANCDGVWSANPAGFDFVLVAHYYQTFWFWAAAGLALLVAIWQAYRARVRYFTRKTHELERIVSLRTAEVRNALQVAQKAQELLLEQATKDSLTGLWNRRAIFEIFDRELKWCRDEGHPFCIVMVDADRFKGINDTYGHLAGDLVIQTISQRLVSGLRVHENVGRYGGEEILILLPRCHLATGLKRAEELRAAIERSPVEYDGKQIPVTCSFGLAQLGSARCIEAMVEEADQALYRAKKEGRNCVRAFDSCVVANAG